MPPSTVVSISTVRDFVSFTLAAADAWGGTLDDPKWGPSGSTGYIDSAIVTADGIVTRAIMETKGHPSRSAYLTATAVTHGSLIGERVGPIGDVRVDSKPAKFASAETIQRWIDAALTYGSRTGYADVRGDRVYFKGTACTVDLCTYTRNGSACQAPSQYTGAVQHLALAVLFKSGGQSEFASHHMRLALLELQGIAGGSDIVDKVLEMMKQE